MKWMALAGLAALAFAAPAYAQKIEVLPIGNIVKVDDNEPKWWAIGGYEIVRIHDSAGTFTPIMRTEVFDARTVEILSRAQVPPLTASDVKIIGPDIVVRRYLLMSVKPQDAKAAGTTVSGLAHDWAAAVARVLPKIAPLPGPFGI
jgi:hypothetical protein